MGYEREGVGMDAEDTEFTRALCGPLPRGLHLAAFEFAISQGRTPLTQRLQSRLHPKIDAVSQWGRALASCFEIIGAAMFIAPQQDSIFGASAGLRLRVDVIATPEVLKKWMSSNGKTLRLLNEPPFFDPNAFYCGIKGPDDAFAKLTGSKVLPTVAHLETEKHEDGWRGIDGFKGILDDEFFPYDEPSTAEDFLRWVSAAQATDKDFEKLSDLFVACNGDPIVVLNMLRQAAAKPEPQSFLVPGLIPRGALTLLLGNKKVGKSGSMLELAVAVARRESSWLGFPLDVGQGGFAVYVHGEDTAGTVLERVALMTGGETPYLLHCIPEDQGDIDAVLARLEKQKVTLLVIDPARKYFRGDEDGSDAVSEFFGKLETFAREKNCAVVVTHHLKRNAFPKSLSDVAAMYRGSSVFLDRPRVTLAMFRSGNETQFGIPAPDGVPLHNFIASTMFSGVRRLRRDESTFRHVPIGAQSGTPKEQTTAEAQAVLAAIGGAISSGKKITRTGKAGVFELKLPALAGMPRTAVRAAVDSLVGQGVLNSAGDGVLTLPGAAAETATSDLVG
jgi:AAA domain